MTTSYETLIHGLQAGRWLGRDTMGMGQLRGGVECVTQPFVCPILIHSVRRASVFVFVNSNIHEMRISQFANTCTKARGAVLGGVGCPPRLPRGTSPRPHGALRTRFARIAACDSHDTRRDDGHTRHQYNHQRHTKAPTTTPQPMVAGGGSPQHHQPSYTM